MNLILLFSWIDGRALAAMVAKFRPDLINFAELSSQIPSESVLSFVVGVIEQEYGLQKPSMSVFEDRKGEAALILYIEKLILRLRRDSGFEEHMVSGTLRAAMNTRKRPKLIDVSNVRKGEGIKRRAEMLNGLLNRGETTAVDFKDSTPSCSTVTPIAEAPVAVTLSLFNILKLKTFLDCQSRK